MGKIQKATRLPKDQADRVEEFAERHELTEADALRRLIRTGLEEEEDPSGLTAGMDYNILGALALTAIIATAATVVASPAVAFAPTAATLLAAVTGTLTGLYSTNLAS
jgi:Flp pilus assembly protein TadB